MPLTREDLENDALRKQYEGLRDHVPLVPEIEFNASLEATLADWDTAQDLWVFAYGSLIWNPLIHYIEQRRALLHGFHRRFCLRSRGARAAHAARSPTPASCWDSISAVAATAWPSALRRPGRATN